MEIGKELLLNMFPFSLLVFLCSLSFLCDLIMAVSSYKLENNVYLYKNAKKMRFEDAIGKM